MGKNMRCKRMKKLKAFKRICYGEKQLSRLMAMLERAADDETRNSAGSSRSDSPPVIDVEKEGSPTMTDVENEAGPAVVDVEMENEEGPRPAPAVIDVEKESVESEDVEPLEYPNWLSHFKVKKFAKMERKWKHKEAKKFKKKQKKAVKRGKKIFQGEKKGKGYKVIMILMK